jgi:hypothetical protein
MHVLIEAFVASRSFDKATLSRLAFIDQHLSDQDIAAISIDDIDAMLVVLA